MVKWRINEGAHINLDDLTCMQLVVLQRLPVCGPQHRPSPDRGHVHRVLYMRYRAVDHGHGHAECSRPPSQDCQTHSGHP